MAWSKLTEDAQGADLTAKLEAHEKENPQVVIKTLEGDVIPEGTPIADLILPGGVAELPDSRGGGAQNARRSV